MKCKGVRLLALLATVFVFIASTFPVIASGNNTSNRFNVMYVVDASGSMRSTDPDGYRYEAMRLFASLLANGGNYLGGVVFNEGILEVIDPTEMRSSSDKNDVMASIEGVSINGDTNIGLALNTAIDSLLDNANPDLPSVILFLSDGNTDLPTDEEMQTSLDLKAEAIQRARDNNIAICSICLNHNGEADISEMEQISSATEGLFIEVENAEDLDEAFNLFYNYIYGSSTIDFGEFTVPEDGLVVADFTVPGLGVEEVNIIVYGMPADTSVFRPDGTESDIEVETFGNITTVKVVDVDPGTWTIQVAGVPGAQIRVNMVYNSDLNVNVDYPDLDQNHYDNEELTISATLSSGDRVSENSEQLEGFDAVLHILDAYGTEINSELMTVDGGSFVYSTILNAGTYRFYVSLDGNYISRTTEVVGPMRVFDATDEDDQEVVDNTPPVAVEDEVEKSFYIWPFVENTYQIDLNGMAIDEEDSELVYRIESSSFMPDDYELSDEGILTINNFSLSKGAFTVVAYDSEGLSCNYEVIVISRNVGIMALIGIGIAALVVLAVLGIVTYILLNKKFMGVCYVAAFGEAGYGEEKSIRKGRGRIHLRLFGQLGDIGLDPNKCYFQATGKNYVYFISKTPIYGDRKLGKKFMISGSGMEFEISSDADGTKGVIVKFKSDLIKDTFF